MNDEKKDLTEIFISETNLPAPETHGAWRVAGKLKTFTLTATPVNVPYILVPIELDDRLKCQTTAN